MNITRAELDKLQQTHAGRLTIGPSAAESLAKIERAAKQTEGYFDLITKAVNVNATQQRSTEDRYKSNTERLYAATLARAENLAWADGTIHPDRVVRWEYEAIAFRLPDWGVFWPDFALWFPGDPLPHFREVKGRGRYSVRDKAKAKFLDARRLFPGFDWQIIQRTGDGWERIL